MKRQLQGIAIILVSILLAFGFYDAGWRYVGHLSLFWSQIFMLTGIAGLVWCFLPEKNK